MSAVVDKGPTPQEAGSTSLFLSPKTTPELAMDMAEGGDTGEAGEDWSDTPDLRTDSDSEQESLDGAQDDGNESKSDLMGSLNDIDEVYESDNESPTSSQCGSRSFVHGMPRREPVFCAEMLHSSPLSPILSTLTRLDPKTENVMWLTPAPARGSSSSSPKVQSAVCMVSPPKSAPPAKLENPPPLRGQSISLSRPFFSGPDTPSSEGAHHQGNVQKPSSNPSPLTPASTVDMARVGQMHPSVVSFVQPSVYGAEVTSEDALDAVGKGMEGLGTLAEAVHVVNVQHANKMNLEYHHRRTPKERAAQHGHARKAQDIYDTMEAM